MRHRSMSGMARAAGLAGLTACGLMMNLVGPAQGQDRVGNSGDTTRGARPGTQGPSGTGLDTQMLVAHGLEMAIEGSTLQALAMRPGAMTGGGSGAGASRSVPTAPRGATDPASRVGGPDTTASGLAGTSRSSGGVVQGGAASSVNDVGVRSEPSGRTTTGAVSMPMMAGSSGDLLRQQAQHSFEDSDRLLASAARDTASDPRFRQAAIRYATTLRTLGANPGTGGPATPGLVGNGTGGSGTFPSATSATGVGGTGNPVSGPGGIAVATGAAPATAGPGGMASTGSLTEADFAAIAAINHEVKESLGALRIRQMFRTAGSTDSPAAQALVTHARQMEAQSRTAIQGILNGAGAAVSGPVQALAQQANELIQTLQAIGG